MFFASSNLNIKTNLLLILITIISICFLTFYHEELPSPLDDYKVSYYYYYSIPLGLIVALIFLNFFAIMFGTENRLRKEALDKIQEVIAKEHELVSLGGQAAAAALENTYQQLKLLLPVKLYDHIIREFKKM